MKTIDRISKIIDYKNISLNSFDKKINASNAYIGKQIRKRASIGSDVIEKIISEFPEINPVWLITGEGEMLKDASAESKTNPSKNNKEDKSEEETVRIELRYCKEMVKSKEKIINLLEETNSLKDEKLKVLTSDNEKLKVLLDNCRKKKNHS